MGLFIISGAYILGMSEPLVLGKCSFDGYFLIVKDFFSLALYSYRALTRGSSFFGLKIMLPGLD